MSAPQKAADRVRVVQNVRQQRLGQGRGQLGRHEANDLRPLRMEIVSPQTAGHAVIGAASASSITPNEAKYS